MDAFSLILSVLISIFTAVGIPSPAYHAPVEASAMSMMKEATPIATETATPIATETATPNDDPVPEPSQPQENSKAVGEFEGKSWWFKLNTDNLPPSAQHDIAIKQYDAYYLGDTQKKIIYLTFDEGYENGYTEEILDTLKEANAGRRL